MSNDSWRTPPQVFNTLNEEFDFIADMACSDENKLCKIGFTEEDNSLSLDWAHAVASKHKFTSNRIMFGLTALTQILCRRLKKLLKHKEMV